MTVVLGLAQVSVPGRSTRCRFVLLVGFLSPPSFRFCPAMTLPLTLTTVDFPAPRLPAICASAALQSAAVSSIAYLTLSRY